MDKVSTKEADQGFIFIFEMAVTVIWWLNAKKMRRILDAFSVFFY